MSDTHGHPSAEWYRQDLERIEADLLAVLRQHWARVGDQLIAHALTETLGSVLGAIVDARPAARGDVLQKVDGLRLHLTEPEGKRPQ